jgi:hypothetical protein
MALNLDELYQVIRTAILANATVRGLLSSADAVYQETAADVRITAPAILMRLINTAPQVQITSAGKFRPALRLRILAQQPDRCRAIEAALQAVLDIPRTTSAGLSNANLRLESCQQVDANEGTAFLTADNAATTTLETVWNCSVRALN